MPYQQIRGSEKLLAALKARSIPEEGIQEIAEAIERSPANVERADVFGGDTITGMQVSLAYADDDVPRCGNDILFWRGWHRKWANEAIPGPRILIDGVFPDLLVAHLGFGDVVSEHAANGQIGG